MDGDVAPVDGAPVDVVEADAGELDPDVAVAVGVVPAEPDGADEEVLGALEVPAVPVVGLLEGAGVLGLGDVDRGVLVEGCAFGVVLAGVTTVTVTGTFATDAGRTTT